MRAGLPCGDCPNAAALRREITELRDEVAEWERQSREAALGAVSDDVLMATRQRLGVTLTQARILHALMNRPGGVVRRGTLRDLGSADETEMKVVDVQVCRLRQNMERAGAPAAIETVWGVGFRLAAADVPALRAWLDGAAGEAAA